MTEKMTAEKWEDISTAPQDGSKQWVKVAEREGLSGFECWCAYHPDAGWCADELRPVTHWLPGGPFQLVDERANAAALEIEGCVLPKTSRIIRKHITAAVQAATERCMADVCKILEREIHNGDEYSSHGKGALSKCEELLDEFRARMEKGE